MTTGSLVFPNPAAQGLKWAPKGGRWKGPFPGPTIQRIHVAFGWVVPRATSTPLGADVPMDGADDIKHSGLGEDLGKEVKA